MTGTHWYRGTSWTVLLAFFTALTACGGSQEAPPPTTTLPVVPTTVVPTTAPAPTLPAQPPEQLSQDQLRELVAPVALYPDVVLASLLPATTYPDQVADAAGWLRQQNGQVQAVPEDRNWDGSVAGLLQFPDVLNWLDQNDPWEEQMGTAMTYQQGDVLQAIQDYRKLALDAGNLQSNQYMKVEAQPNQDIRIAPAQPDVVYVPQYDTAAVTQPQPASGGINPWLAFGGGAVVGALGAWALYSIFDDDDGGNSYHKKKVVKTYNNYYYGGGQRPPSNQWNPRPRPGRPGRPGGRPGNEIVRPKPIEPIYTAKPGTRPAGGQAGVRPPQKRPGGQPGQVAQPRPAPPPPVVGDTKEQPRKQGGGGQGRGGGQGQGGKQQKQKATPAPATRESGVQSQQKPSAKPEASSQQQQQQQKQQQENGQKNQSKKKKKKGGGNY